MSGRGGRRGRGGSTAKGRKDPGGMADDRNEVNEAAEEAADGASEDVVGAAVPGAVEPPEAVAEPPEARLAAELAELQDRYLRLAAEYDNFRKRTTRERLELRTRAQGDLVSALLDALDDLGRVAHLDPQATAAGDVLAGVELVERKMLRQLEAAGLQRIAETGVSFDPHQHEAVAQAPAESPEQDHTVAAILQVGYRFGGQLLRPARVQVHLWSGEGAPGT